MLPSIVTLNTITGFEVWDINSNVLQSSSIVFPDKPNNTGTTSKMGVVEPSYHDTTVTDLGNGNIRIQTTRDVEFFWGLLSIDICSVDITINISQL